MPLHRHECESCGHRFRILVTHGTKNDTPTCPECGSMMTRRMMPLVGIHFTGSGYYKTDHVRRGGGGSDKHGGETEPGESGETRSSGDSKASNGTKARDKSKDSATFPETSSTR
jgi:putative FmdB family regulatory protein